MIRGAWDRGQDQALHDRTPPLFAWDLSEPADGESVTRQDMAIDFHSGDDGYGPNV
jgi:hypothetical protein